MVSCHTCFFMSQARLASQMLIVQQEKDEVADIVIDEAPAPVEIDESPSVSDRKLYHLFPTFNIYKFQTYFNTSFCHRIILNASCRICGQNNARPRARD